MTKEWDGVCACGKAAMDGVKCRLGATHISLKDELTRSEKTDIKVDCPPK